jgi:hypothetical protein
VRRREAETVIVRGIGSAGVPIPLTIMQKGGLELGADGTGGEDGGVTPRLSPVEPFVLDGDLWLSMMLGSLKASDLVRDPRVLVHSIVTNRDGEEGEVRLRGTARQHLDEAVQRRYADAVTEALPLVT